MPEGPTSTPESRVTGTSRLLVAQVQPLAREAVGLHSERERLTGCVRDGLPE